MTFDLLSEQLVMGLITGRISICPFTPSLGQTIHQSNMVYLGWISNKGTILDTHHNTSTDYKVCHCTWV